MEARTLSLHMRLRLQAEGTTGPEMGVMVTSGDLLNLLDERPPLSGLDFTPDAQHTIADMANVGYRLLQEIQAYRPGYVYSVTPAEIVGDLCEQLSGDEQVDVYESFQAAAVRMVEESPAKGLCVLTGAFVSMTLALMEAQGHRPIGEIFIDGDKNRNITIHAPKGTEQHG